jgi:hypothetical protein
MRKLRYSRPLTFALPPAHYDEIKALSDRLEISMANWVRQAVGAALDKTKREEDQTDDN